MPARQDEGSSPRCPPTPRLRRLGDYGGTQTEAGGASGHVLRGEASPRPGKVVGKRGRWQCSDFKVGGGAGAAVEVTQQSLQ